MYSDGWIRLPDDFDKPEFATVTIQWGLFYGNDTLLENVSDPSHIDFAHHKVIGRFELVDFQLIGMSDFFLPEELYHG